MSWPTSRRWWLLGAVVILAAGAFFLAPRRVSEVVTIDGQSRWRQPGAPAQRAFVWQQAEPLAASGAEVNADGAGLIRPALADFGQTLYFTKRHADGTADIYRARRGPQGWLEAQPVEELNSASDDVGPLLSPNGRQLWLYSNRPGGLGGFDIYGSQRRGDGWSEPRNLGVGVNTPAHDQDGALSPDGLTFYFSSNRTAAMQAPPEEGKDKHWTATMRAAQGLRHFDLYASTRASAEDDWSWPLPLAGANSAASEGEPFVSPSGAYLYFASDRPNASGEPINFDIYRGRINGLTLAEIQNLGSGVNTRANEHEPAVSHEGFRMVFSSDRGETRAGADAYRLYSSAAVEILDEQAWDASRLRAFVSFLARNIWWIVLLVLLAALILAVRWWRAQASLGRAQVPAFFLVALLLHLLIGSGSFFVYFGDDFAESIEQAFDEVLVVANLHQSHEAGQESYEKVADLQSVETVEPAPAPPRQVTETTNIPVPVDSAVPSLPMTVGSQQPQQQPVEMAAEITPVPAPQLQRRSLAQPAPAAAAVALQPTEAPADTPDTQIPSQQVAAERAVTEMQVASPRPQLPARSAPAPVPAEVQVQLVPESPAVNAPAAPAALAKSGVQVAAADLPRPQLAAIEPTPATAEPDVVRPAVDAAAPDTSVSPQTESLQLHLPRQLAAAAGPAAPPPRVRPITGISSSSPSPQLSRAARIPTAIEDGALQLAETTVPAGGDKADEEALAAAKVDLARTSAAAPAPAQEPSAPVADLAAGPAPSTLPRLAAADVLKQQPPAQPAAPSRRVTLRPAIDDAPQVALVDGQAAPRSADAPGAASVEGEQVALSRAGQSLEVEAPAGAEAGGPHRQQDPRLIVGSLARQSRSTPPTASPIASRLQRRPARAPLLNYAEDNVGLQAMLRLRGADTEVKRDLVQAFGGNDKVLQVVSVGLNWIAQHQHEDGHWGLHNFSQVCRDKNCKGHGSHASDTAGTGLALLPFLGDGYTHQFGDYQPVVKKGLDWIVKHQKDDGDLFTGQGNARMYSHGIATIAICEAYGMTNDEVLRGPAQKAVDFIVAAQHNQGGWRYQPKQAGDMSVMGWQLMALKSAQIAGLNVPEPTLNKARQWLHKNEGQGNKIGTFGYQGPNGKPAMTAEAMLCLEYLGTPRGDPHLQGAARYLLNNLPQQGKNTSYYWYYGTQAMFHMQGDSWRQWNDSLREALVNTQVKDGHHAGSWTPHDKDNWEKAGGRLYATSLRLLMLEVYYRHLPLYQVLEEE